MSDALWYKDAVFYQLHVRAFFDSNGDGTGDFCGLRERLDYVQDLGVTALWLMPFYPSPQRDDGYDITDYRAVHPEYGSMDDFHSFLEEAHRRELRVIIDLVLNHTSDQHLWFQRARRARPGTAERDFYVWSDDPGRYPEARLIYDDAESSNWSWDPLAHAYYWHRFYSHEPDLNYDNSRVQQAMLDVLDHWFEQGVDGIGLAAVPYLFEREDGAGENLPETHTFLRALRAHVDERFPGRVLLAEANAWPEEAARYLEAGAECQLAVHFPVSPRLFMAVRMEDRFPLLDILKQTPPIPETCQWAVLLRNQDELALQMVTDEERDYMFRSFAPDPHASVHGGLRRRLAPLLGNDRRQIELLNGLLFSLIGSPVIYYGDEIGMGDNIYLGDRAGLRTPMQWSPDRNAGFSRADPQCLYVPVNAASEYHFEAVNVETQLRNPSSLLNWTRRLVALRKGLPALGRGALRFLPCENRKVLAFTRHCPPTAMPGADCETVLVVANLSHFAEHVTLDLSEFAGHRPREVAGQRDFPVIGTDGYFFTLAPYAFHWFTLRPLGMSRPGRQAEAATAQHALATLSVSGSWKSLLEGEGRVALEALLPDTLRSRRWFRGKARPMRSVEILDALRVPYTETGAAEKRMVENQAAWEAVERSDEAWIVPVRVDYAEGEPEIYILPLAYAPPERARDITERQPGAAVAWLTGDAPGLLYDATANPAFSQTLLDAIAARRTFSGRMGMLRAQPSAAFERLRGPAGGPLPAHLGSAEQSNTSVVFGNRLIMKVYRRIEGGINPDLEVTRFLTERTSFSQIAAVAGALEYYPGHAAKERTAPVAAGGLTLGILQSFVANQGDAWEYTLGALEGYLGRALAATSAPPDVHLSTAALLHLDPEYSSLAQEMIGSYLGSARLLGRRTAEMHLALASDAGDPAFAPEPFTQLYQRSLYQSWRALADGVFELFRRRIDDLPAGVRSAGQELLGLEGRLLERFRAINGRRVHAARIRTHGDYHLGQVLYTGDDFVIIDFEGEPSRPLSERRFKRGALRDVAGMLRSFQYAAYGKALFDQERLARLQPAEQAALDAWARFWQLQVCGAYLNTYIDTAGPASFLPASHDELALLLDVYLLEKATYELGYELNNRPAWVMIPVRSILQLLRD
jgi:maltose alpha-D-glucosyltransferase / alpha-amylase